ncbi:ArsR family transcriptional regulator [Sphingobium sp. KCTC 72723]|uniref:ArsR family transcriptional regulator n=1 Tax=Sphingobium sp. KCTC 72723 TaxID=2733867 RepID=UPI00165E4359|nr:ArsR family transcriptional regulator [Sphingobium sp. KCTC 72723]
MTAHIPPDRAVPSQEAIDLVVALQRCLTNVHARADDAAVLNGEGGCQLATLVRYIESRRVRSVLLGQNLFADPAWDILLMLYQADLEERALTLEQLSETLRLSMSVTVGQIGVMERRGLVEEHQTSPNSRRRRAIRLSPLAVDSMSSWFSLAFGTDG